VPNSPSAATTGSADSAVIAPAELEAWARSTLEDAGASPEAATVTARVLVDANRRGLDSHGVVFLTSYLTRLRVGSTRGDAHPEIVIDLPGLTVVDGHDALGPYVASFGMQQCCSKAKKSGASVALVRNSSHFGAASFYSEQAARDGCIGVVLSNSDPGLAPLGGIGPLLGTNPLAIAAPPASDGTMPSLDIATSVVAQGKIVLAEKAGAQIPDGWAIGPDGSPTTDPTEALAGAVLPMAGHKGFGLAFMIDVLTACAAGAPPSPDVVGDPESETPQGVSHCFIAVHVDTAGSRETYQRSLSELVARVHAAPRAAWAESFLAPGEPEARASAERRELIPLSPASVAALRNVGRRSGLAFPLQ
jgi:LDH2 family malate/lactate/ureidoglycolate dehydrogenase